MLTEGVVIAIITGVLAVLGSYMGNVAISRQKARQDAIHEAEREQQQKDQLEMIFKEQQAIKKRLDQHNKYAEKFTKTEKAIVAVQKDIEYLKERIKNGKSR